MPSHNSPRDARSVLCASSSRRPLSRLAIVAIVGCYGANALAEDTEPFNPDVEPGGAAEIVVEDLPPVDIDLRSGDVEEVAERVLAVMSLREKIGQLCQVTSYGESTPAELRAGRIGSLFYTGNAEHVREAQRIAQEESRLGLPLLTARDVIHGFRTVFPIPVGQAASWNPELIEKATAVAAEEAAAEGVNWTFAPMLDISRDARWGRIAESVGEDPYLASAIASAMVRGYQQPEEGAGDTTYRGIAACAKHFAAYGLSEGGRDYNRAQVSTSELHSAILPPFKSAIEAGCATVMTGFNTINGVPGTGHRELVTEVLKEGWGFDGLVVSDWASIVEMIAHGYAADRRDAARLALQAGVDMEMATTTFQEHVLSLHEAGVLSDETIDQAVLRVLRTKLRFAMPAGERADTAELSPLSQRLETSRKLAEQSCVLIKNDSAALPLNADGLSRVAVIGPLADAARDQLGCWMLDGKPEDAVTPLAAIRSALKGQAEVRFAAGLSSSIDPSTDGVADAVAAAADSDVAIVCVGEGWQLSGEARCRADLHLPGAQRELVSAVAETGKPIVLVVLAGRPLTIGAEIDLADAVLYAWHPGTMGGPAIADLLLGKATPSGKLPVTFPKHVGQSPLYYNHPSTGRPPIAGTRALIGSGLNDFPELQKYRSHYLDVDPFPLLPFGYGLSYTTFEYGEAELTRAVVERGQTIGVRVPLTNTGAVAGTEVAQLYVQDVAARLVRPVRELKRFRRVYLEPGETVTLEFALSTDDLAYYDNDAKLVLEPGEYRLGVGGDSTAPLSASFSLREPAIAGENTPSRAASRR